jgi:hypothetical protein
VVVGGLAVVVVVVEVVDVVRVGRVSTGAVGEDGRTVEVVESVEATTEGVVVGVEGLGLGASEVEAVGVAGEEDAFDGFVACVTMGVASVVEGDDEGEGDEDEDEEDHSGGSCDRVERTAC